MAPPPLVRSLPKFKVRRSEPVFVPPKLPTPREFKRLSDLDHEASLRVMVPTIAICRSSPHRPPTNDPASLIKEAIAHALVFFYPLAGRIRHCSELTPSLVVECTGEGALFIEADADITADEFGDSDALHPPFPFLDEILYQVPGMSDVIDCPILHVQVTRLKCGGFIVGLRYNNIMLDGTGFAQFMTAGVELLGGAEKPSILPVWDRDRLFARRPPRETCIHPEFEDDAEPVLVKDKAYRIFYLTPKEIDILRDLMPEHLQSSTSFELITGFLWRSRTIALKLTTEEDVRIVFAVNARDKFNPPLPKGFYGNAFAFAGSIAKSGELCKNSLSYAVEMVANAKKKVTEEYMRSFIDGLTLRGWPRVPRLMTSFFVSDLRKMGFIDVDFGWGPTITSCPGDAWYEPYPHEETDYFLCKNSEGEPITVVPISLPAAAMRLLEEEMYSVLKIHGVDPFNGGASASKVIRSNL